MTSKRAKSHRSTISGKIAKPCTDAVLRKLDRSRKVCLVFSQAAGGQIIDVTRFGEETYRQSLYVPKDQYGRVFCPNAD